MLKTIISKRRLGFARLASAILAGLAVATPVAAAPATVYATNCAMCHQPSGLGLTGQFPRLAGRVGPIAATPAGRHYLARVLLNGMYGSIVVDGTPIMGLMPSMESVPDADIAAALNHAIALKKPAKPVPPFTAAEIAKVRAEGKVEPSQNVELRTKLQADGVIP